MQAQNEAGLYDLSLIRGQDMDMYSALLVGDLTVLLPTFFYRAHDGLRVALRPVSGDART